MRMSVLLAVIGIFLAAALGFAAHVVAQDTIGLPAVSLEGGRPLAPDEARRSQTEPQTETRPGTETETEPEVETETETRTDNSGPGSSSSGPGSGGDDTSGGRGPGRGGDD